MPGIQNVIGTTFRSAAFGGGGTPPNPNFVSTWDTTKAGSASDTIVLPMTAGTATVDWGDGTIDTSNTHTYAVGGIKTITIIGVMPNFKFNNGGDKKKILNISNWGSFITFTNGQRAFQDCSNLTITANDYPIIATTNMREFFSRCTSLTNEDFSAWDMSSVTTLNGMFYGCTNFNGNVSNWDVHNVTVFGASGNFSGTFENCTKFNGDLSGWDVSSGLDMAKMFSEAVVFNQDLSSWDINQVTNFLNFMIGCTLSTVNYDALLVAWDAKGAMSYSGIVNFGGSKYTSGGAAEAARTSLITKWGGITDGGAA